MSWIERVNRDLTITCGGELNEDENGTLIVGDGVKVFSPNWIDASKNKDFNIAELNFKGIQGSLVKRGTSKGAQYDMTLFFQGADHIDVAKDFETKCEYVNPTTGMAPPLRIAHPYYGYIYVQPTSLTLDNTEYNVTKVRMMVIETIKENGDAYTKEDIESTTIAAATKLNAGYIQSYTAEVTKPDVFDLQRMRDTINNSYGAIMGAMNGYQQDVDKYMKYYNDANALINTAVYDTSQLLGKTQQLLGAPAYFADTVVNRIAMFKTQLSLLNRDVQRILDIRNRPTRTLKRLYEINAGAGLIGMSMTTILNITNDYDYRPDVINLADTIINEYNKYISNLVNLQSLTGDLIDSWLPDPENIVQINTLIKLTTSNLFNISAASKQQRKIITTTETNLLLLADELYGRADEVNVQTLKKNNNIDLNEIFVIKPGREIIYYK